MLPRTPQTTTRPDIPPDGNKLSGTTINPEIVTASSSSTTFSPTSPPPSTADAGPSASSAPTSASPPAHGRTSSAKVAAIVIPVAAVILVIPLIFLLYRSHQLKQAASRRRSQRSSREAMLQWRPSISKDSVPQIAPTQHFGSKRSRESRLNGSPPRPTNSLGLFNFDLSPSPTPRTSTPMTPLSSHLLSVAHAMPVRRSQASVVDGRQPPPRRSSDRSQPGLLSPNPPPPYTIPQEPQNPHFAPLNQIGTAYSKNDSRPNLHRKPSGRSAISKPSHDTLSPPDVNGWTHGHSNLSEHLPQIPCGGLNWGSRFTRSDNHRYERFSDVSSLSDYGDQDRRVSQQSHTISPLQEDDAIQPFGIL